MKAATPIKSLTAAFAIFFFLIAMESVFHYIPWLHNLYIETASVWRPLAEIDTMMSFVFGHYIVLSITIVWLYKCYATTTFNRAEKSNPYTPGLRFGFAIGIIMALMKTDIYPYLPIPLSLAAAWLAQCVIEGIGLGLILALIFKPKIPDAA